MYGPTQRFVLYLRLSMSFSLQNAPNLCYLGGMSTSHGSHRNGLGDVRRWAAVGALLSIGTCGLIGLAGTPAAAAATHAGPVDVLSAGSFQDLLQQQIGPAFHQATGYTLNDTSMGSDALASGIKGGTLQGDVFLSASPTVNATLEGTANGNWVSWDAPFATSPLVLGYNSGSRFAHALKTKPWYDVIDQPGFLIGRTDPTTDPKGVLAVTALD
jgi:molybdate/tungstate transport system substrate-binding protein